MNRILRGAVVFAASALVWACNTEPEETQGGDPDHLVLDPAVIIVEEGSTEEVFVRLVDQQGTSLPTEFSVTAAGPQVTVTADPLHRPIYAADGSLVTSPANTDLRLVVTGAALGTTSFTVTAEGLSEEVNVTVVPSDVNATFTPVAPLAGDTVTITLGAGLQFGRAFVIRSLRGDNPIRISTAADSLSARYILPPNALLGDLVIDSVRATFNPDAGLFGSLPLDAVPPTPTASRYAGSNACATATPVALPAVGTDTTSRRFWDLAPTGANFRYYSVTMPAATKLRVQATPSPSNAGMSLAIVDPATCTVVSAGSATVTSGQRAVTTANLVAGATVVVRVGTGTVALPNGQPSPTLAAVQYDFAHRP